ncbi:two-component response receiver and regulator protein [Desulforapulum autotrophicum HRM2]|uniref:Two-component response receiver and regulator protein n=1 Tax=Desulforapulum autotrophicum (strain ATCC 43914 / DSM 3382 / VKM B-1955 / HRM2) TaxID=177437 RepID=C0QI64_DESAH|nr:DUF3369 domain-containing protein [Desulforapulum autotrophicum]ACN15800.1 two-component response receiver and regulator protein [Desulforapulum autotrophicum HRM2]
MAADNEMVLFADEDICLPGSGRIPGKSWKILVADDEPDVHEITRIALASYQFDGCKVELLAAYSGADVKEILARENDVALILLDVVMERENTGLALVQYIREELNNDLIRIVIRTGQPGKAPEHEVITRYDINDYTAKTELTAQKLFTAVTASLRAYASLKTIEANRQGLERIIHSNASLFESRSLSQFATGVLDELKGILKLNLSTACCQTSLYAATTGGQDIIVLAARGDFKDKEGLPIQAVFSPELMARFQRVWDGEENLFAGDEYLGGVQTKEGARCLLYFDGCSTLSTVEQNLVRIYTTNVGIGFDNLSLTREIVETQKEVIYTLGEIVETRSKETANHVIRVAEFCYLLAQKYGIDPTCAERLKLASPMHDIGKIGIPETILHKPGRLTKEEFEIIKTHAETGYYILKNSKRQILQTAAIVAWQHHEKWDGSGYPQGLSREDIHIYGRITAVADVFDALSHKRCYKDAWSMDRIMELFKKESGKHFDPALMDIFLAEKERFVEINERFPE